MRKGNSKRIISLVACAGMLAGCLSPMGSVITKAATKEIERADASIVYFVDAGDYVTNTTYSAKVSEIEGRLNALEAPGS